MKSALLGVLFGASVAHAGVAAGPSAARESLPAPSWADLKDVLPVSDFAGDLYCPHTDEPGPRLIVVPDRGQARGELAPVAHLYASNGYVVQVAELAALRDVIAAPVPEMTDEPGCRTTGATGVVAFGASGRAALQLHGVATVVVLYGTFAPSEIGQRVNAPEGPAPALLVEPNGTRIEPSKRTYAYDVSGTLACDFRPIENACWADRRVDWVPAREQVELANAQRRQQETLGATIPWLRVQLDHDPRAQHFLESPRVQIGIPMGLVAEKSDLMPASTSALFSLSMLAGYASDGGFTIGGRMELLYDHHRERIRRGVGAGVYGSLAYLSDHGGIASTGLTAAGFLGNGTALAPSAGIYSSSLSHGATAGVFFGARGDHRWTMWDTPVGLRIDGNYGTGADHERSITVSLQTDVRATLAGVAGLLALGLVPRN